MSTFTDKQMRSLAKYERELRTAYYSQWARGMAKEGLEEIHAIYGSATGSERRLNVNCATCILELLTDCGRLYFAQKEGAKAKTKKG